MGPSASPSLRGRIKAVLLVPLKLLAMLVLIAFIILVNPFVRAGERRKSFRRLRALELDLGTVLERPVFRAGS
jgi:hypothetical protein